MKLSRDSWARNQSANPNIKIYIGAAASTSAAGAGYVDASILADIATQAQRKYPSFGGVMLWDMSQAYGAKKATSSPGCPILTLNQENNYSIVGFLG